MTGYRGAVVRSPRSKGSSNVLYAVMALLNELDEWLCDIDRFIWLVVVIMLHRRGFLAGEPQDCQIGDRPTFGSRSRQEVSCKSYDIKVDDGVLFRISIFFVRHCRSSTRKMYREGTIVILVSVSLSVELNVVGSKYNQLNK
eukprot:1188722-Prorocentrum_minimum.AAC.4